MPEPKNEWHIYKDAAGEWRWNVAAAENGEILASGEGYVDRRDAEKVVARLSGGTPDEHDSETYRFSLVHDAVVDAEGNDCG